MSHKIHVSLKHKLIRGVGAVQGLLDTKTPLLVLLASNSVNFCLDVLLIFGSAPLNVPALGAPGAAAATVVAGAMLTPLWQVFGLASAGKGRHVLMQKQDRACFATIKYRSRLPHEPGAV